MNNDQNIKAYRWRCNWLGWLVVIFLLYIPPAAIGNQEKVNANKFSIAYIAYVEDTWKVFVMDAAGSQHRYLVDSGLDTAHISWSSGSGKILVNDNQGQLAIVDTNTHVIKQLDIEMRGMTDTSWSSDGKKIIFSLSIANSIDANDIWLLEIGSYERRRLTNMKHMQHDPAWSHDEKQVVFVSGAGGQNHDLFVLDMETGATRQLTVAQRYHFEPACSVNDEIAFSSNRSGDYEIWVCDLEGKRFEQITHNPGMDGQPTWSPDGEKIAFVSTRSGYPAIWVVNRDGSDSHQISPEGMSCRGPVWSR